MNCVVFLPPQCRMTAGIMLCYSCDFAFEHQEIHGDFVRIPDAVFSRCCLASSASHDGEGHAFASPEASALEFGSYSVHSQGCLFSQMDIASRTWISHLAHGSDIAQMDLASRTWISHAAHGSLTSHTDLASRTDLDWISPSSRQNPAAMD